MNILYPLIIAVSTLFYTPATNSSADCLKHEYKGTWKGNSIYFTISSADYNNLLSYKGKLVGFTKYKNNVCPFSGTFSGPKDWVFSVSFSETSEKSYCNAGFDGSITCYSNSTVFEGEIRTPGEWAPKYEEITMRATD